MKYFGIIFVVCISISFTHGLHEQQKAKLQEFKTACIAETGVSPVAVENAKKGNIDENDEKLACFAACLLKKAGFMSDEGVFNEAAFRAQIPATIPTEKVDAIVNKCKSQSGANVCEIGGNLLKCYLENKTLSLFE